MLFSFKGALLTLKTVFELQYEKAIILSIAESECSEQERAERFYEFYRNGMVYYEELCDALYYLSTKQELGNLYINPAGKPYISFTPRNFKDRKLFSGEELPLFQSDLQEQLTYFLQAFSISKGNKLVNPKRVDKWSTM